MTFLLSLIVALLLSVYLFLLSLTFLNCGIIPYPLRNNSIFRPLLIMLALDALASLRLSSFSVNPSIAHRFIHALPFKPTNAG